MLGGSGPRSSGALGALPARHLGDMDIRIAVRPTAGLRVDQRALRGPRQPLPPPQQPNLLLPRCRASIGWAGRSVRVALGTST